jgi:PAS domain S-box-containing protein
MTLSAYRIGTIVKYVGILGLGPTQLWFGLTYSGRKELLNRRRWALLLAWPAIIFVLVLTAPAHDLLWNVEGFISEAPLANIERTDSPLVWLNIAYVYALASITYVLIALVGIKRGGRYRIQVVLMLAGGIIPLAASMALLSTTNLAAPYDPTAFSFTVTGIVFAIALFRFDLLDLVPTARHALVDEMNDPIFVVDIDNRLVDMNGAAVELLGGKKRDALGQFAADVIPSYDSLGDDDGESGADVTLELGDTPRYFDTTQTALTDRSGTKIGSLFIYRDVTDRHIVEERFKRLIERSSDIVGILDGSGTVTYISQSVENVLGYEPTELMGENIVNRIHPDDREDIAAELSKYVDDHGYTGTYRARFRDSDGEWRVLESRAANLLDDPFVEGIVLNSRDVTEKQQQKRKLERQNERLDQFASVVSHDLRNPLTVAAGQLDLLEMELESEHKETIETIQRQLDRIEDIIDDSLTLARSGEIVTETEEIDLETVAGDAWNNVDTGETELLIRETQTIEGNRSRLLNMFENLFRNSVEHNAATDLAVRVGALSDNAGFYIEDTGEGISQENREDAFEWGYTTNQEGTGFGLAIVKEIIQAHGWQMSLTESEEGGARFEIECNGVPVETQTETA